MEKLNLDLKFDILDLGNGNAELIPEDPDSNPYLPKCVLPFGLPPFLPTMEEKLEEFLSHPEYLPIHDLEKCQKYWPRKPHPEKLLKAELHPLSTELRVDRDPTVGKLLGFHEVLITDLSNTSKNSMSMRRLPGPPTEAVRGSTTNFPFLPGGMEEPTKEQMEINDDEEDIDFENDLLIKPPGFKTGIDFNEILTQKKEEIKSEIENKNIINLADVFNADDLFHFTELNERDQLGKIENAIHTQKFQFEDDEQEEVENIIPQDIPMLNISKTPSEPRVPSPKEWAEEIDSSKRVPDFQKRIPNMAHKPNFTLDAFQEHAVLHLENSECVFIAAHTSAGKTVIAEYAIALTLQHNTRAIYTSPIKALSNQKFRDFKELFQDKGKVGLLTGDIQIEGDAPCLIMTTEILRSMLYRGADTVRDLEWVIFDEVHYVNDLERGVVWEEVVIMLPQHVKVIMLSATVPNVMDFADWVGRTIKKKIYVITTLKRPVPLEHYLYTGFGGKTRDDRFLLVDEHGKFLKPGYRAAFEAKIKAGPKGDRDFLNPKQEITLWSGIVSHLKKEDPVTRKNLLPVVVFTFSRKRCDSNARLLWSQDLTTAVEKGEINHIFSKYIQRLKPYDQQLPQVKTLKELLSNGIGIHHSGILPILKEIVELLFQENYVKILFATETFAMGVNMPARTVIFDSIKKHDGRNFRILEPSEYIQMAGRAGRRGKDKKGTVIILCKVNVPAEMDLQSAMLGKPTKLESKFRLTYSMILNLLRSNSISVDYIMKHSFSEADEQRQLTKYQAVLEKYKKLNEEMDDVTCSVCTKDIKVFLSTAEKVIDVKRKFQVEVSSKLTPGRVVIINYESQGNTLATILSVRKKLATLLVLTDAERNEQTLELACTKPIKHHSNSKEDKDPVLKKVNLLAAFVKQNIFLPEGSASHTVIDMSLDDNIFIEITKESLCIDAKKIVDDWRKREQPRFRFDPPNQSCNLATQELLRLSENNRKGLPRIDYGKTKNIDLVDEIDRIDRWLDVLHESECINCPNFKEHLYHQCQKFELQIKIEESKFKLSRESLKLFPDYEARLAVLKDLGYIEQEIDSVTLKGKVACQINNHELIVTEIMLEGMFNDSKPEEIAALLSCLVFQQKADYSEETLTKPLKEGISKIKYIIHKIEDMQNKHCVEETVSEFAEQFSFGLVEVVYNWSKQMSFAEIARITDIQEGIIVRCIQRLDETLRDVKTAAFSVGDSVLAQKMEEASKLIKRDIVFAASLYTQ